jgi:hypothetical protein
MARFFNKFPLIQYNMSGKKYPEYQTVTNLLFRTAIIREIINNSSAYIKYIVRDGDTPDILASKVYGDPESHWLILYANEMLDPQYDWPLTTSVFYKYIVDKYRSMAEADIGNPLQDFEVVSWTQDRTNDASVHHYEKVVKQFNSTTQTNNEIRYIINKSKLTDNELDVPYEYYDNLADEQDVTPINVTIKGQTLIETVYRDFITYYDYEDKLNEEKRNIRIIKQEYYSQILAEFNAITGAPDPTFFRRVS